MSDSAQCVLATASDTGPGLSELLHAVARHDRSALESLYQTCRQGIFAVALSVTRDRQLAEDVLQDTMLYLWAHADAYRRDGHPKAWMLTIARHLAMDLMRKNHRTVLLESWDEVPGSAGMTLPADMVSDLELSMAISKLAPAEAQVLILFSFAGLSHGETAKLLGIPYYKVRYRYRRAIGKLRVLLSVDE